MTTSPRKPKLWASRVTIDRVYAGILLTDRCNCGDLANDHEAKFVKSTKHFAVKCVIPGCRCTTFIANKTRADYLAEHQQRLERMSSNAN